MERPKTSCSSFARKGLVGAVILATVGCGALPDDSESQKQPEVKSTDADQASQVEEPDDVAVDPEPVEGQAGDPPASSARVPCTSPTGAPVALETIAQIVELLNSMPKPVSIPCFLDVLARPLYVNATASDLSVQPASSPTIPRIFIFSGPTLILSFVPAGEGSHTLEMSSLTSNTASVKGELPFPVTATLAADAAYTSIANLQGTGTTCAGCHSAEAAAPSSYGPGAYVSTALKPLATRDVSLFDLKFQHGLCQPDDGADPCAGFEALFGHGEVLPKAFPPEMPTLF